MKRFVWAPLFTVVFMSPTAGLTQSAMGQCQGGGRGGPTLNTSAASGMSSLNMVPGSALSATASAYQQNQSLQQFVVAQQQYIRQLEANQQQLMAELQRLRNAQNRENSVVGTRHSFEAASPASLAGTPAADQRKQQTLRKNANTALAAAERSEAIGDTVAASRYYRRVVRILPSSDLAATAAARLTAIHGQEAAARFVSLQK